MKVIVGCPMYQRMWVLPAWAEAMKEACGNANVKPEFLFACGPSEDGTTEWAQDQGEVFMLDETNPQEHREWNGDRYHHMADIRNQLLAAVREREPDLFLAIDSDILLHPEALANMMESAPKYDAVGGKCYLDSYMTGRSAPNYAMYKRATGGYSRADITGGVLKVDVLLANVLMKPRAYNIDYAWHHQAEDFGWSMAGMDAGLSFGYDARVCSKHIMQPEWLNKYDKRCGY